MPAEVATEEDDRDCAFFYSWPRSIGWDYGSSEGIRLGRWPLSELTQTAAPMIPMPSIGDTAERHFLWDNI